MPVIRSSRLVPEVYVNGSRDFEMLCGVYDKVFNMCKYYTDTMKYITDTRNINSDLLNLLSTKIGFETDKDFNDDYMRSALEALPILIRSKGSLGAIKKLIYMCLKLYNTSASVTVSVTTEQTTIGNVTLDPHTVIIGTDDSFHGFDMIKEIGKYLIPVGFGLYVYFYQGSSVSSYVQYQNGVEMLFTSSNIDSQVRSNLQSIVTGPQSTDRYSFDMSLDTISGVLDFKVTDEDSNLVSIFTHNYTVKYVIDSDTSQRIHRKVITTASSPEEAKQALISIMSPIEVTVISANREDYLFDGTVGAVGSSFISSDQNDISFDSSHMLGVYSTSNNIPSGTSDGDIIIKLASSSDFTTAEQSLLPSGYQTYQTYYWLNSAWNPVHFLGTFDRLPSASGYSNFDIVSTRYKSVRYYNNSQWEELTFRGRYTSTSDVSSPVTNDCCFDKTQNGFYIYESGSWNKMNYCGEFYNLVDMKNFAQIGTVSGQKDVATVYGSKYYIKVPSSENWVSYTNPMYMMQSFLLQEASA